MSPSYPPTTYSFPSSTGTRGWFRATAVGATAASHVRREEDLGEDPLGLLREPCSVLLRHAQRGGARARLRLDDMARTAHS